MTPWVFFVIFSSSMPGRKVLLVTDQVYHILNRGVTSQPIFLNKRNYHRALGATFYYQNKNLPLSYAAFLELSNQRREETLQKLREQKNFLVEIVAFCLMPNHFHFLLKQVQEEGISVFMSNFSNSYTRYFNTSCKRTGHLFQGKFKAVRIETEKQLLHVSRYIHLNPYTSYVVRTLKELEVYPYSSFPEYLKPQRIDFCYKEVILSGFKKTTDYKKFVFDQADYQRRLEGIRHLMLEE